MTLRTRLSAHGLVQVLKSRFSKPGFVLTQVKQSEDVARHTLKINAFNKRVVGLSPGASCDNTNWIVYSFNLLGVCRGLVGCVVGTESIVST